MKVATLEPFHGYKTPSTTPAPSSTRSMLSSSLPPPSTRSAAGSSATPSDAGAVKATRLDAIRNILRAGQEHLTRRQRTRLQTALAARDEHVEVEVAYQCSQQLRSAYHQTRLTDGRAIAERIIATFHTCPVPEIARLGRTLKQRAADILAFFDRPGTSNGPTEAICESGFGWSGTGWSGWRRSCRPGCDSRSNWPACGVFPLNCPLGSARSAPFGPPR